MLTLVWWNQHLPYYEQNYYIKVSVCIFYSGKINMYVLNSTAWYLPIVLLLYRKKNSSIITRVYY